MAAARGTGEHFICRREVYDVLSAAGGALPYEELRDEVEPRLRKYLTREIENAGSLDGYLKPRLETFSEKAGGQPAMLSRPDLRTGNVQLRPGARVYTVYPDGRLGIYRPGMNEALEQMSRIDERLLFLRRKGTWDGLVRRGDPEQLERSLEQAGWLPSQVIVRDRTGYLVDGRVRADICTAKDIALNATNAGTGDSVRRPTVAQGVVQSYLLNESRLSTSQREQFKRRVAKDLRVEWDELMLVYCRTLDWLHTRPATTVAETEVTVDDRAVKVSQDGTWIQMRSLLIAANCMYYNIEQIRRAFAGLEMPDASAVWVRASDLEEFLDGSPKPLWSNQERWTAFEKVSRQVIAMLKGQP